MRASAAAGLALGSLLLASLSEAGQDAAGRVVGRSFKHRVEEGDTLATVGARFGVDAAVLAHLNDLAPGSPLTPGEKIRVDNRHVVPRAMEDGIVVNVPQRMLFLFRNGKVAGAYPVGVGRRGWKTPPGQYRIVKKEVDPSWEVPSSIQREMRRQGKRVVKRMPPGPDNPLGQYWLGLSRGGIGIHGTASPSSLYRFVSHGCIRLHPEDIESVFRQVEVDTPVEVVYQPVLLGYDRDDGVYLEVHRDTYGRGHNAWREAQRQAASAGITPRVDWAAARTVLARREGVARMVGGGRDFAYEDQDRYRRD